jgi:hypothetical protein
VARRLHTCAAGICQAVKMSIAAKERTAQDPQKNPAASEGLGAGRRGVPRGLGGEKLSAPISQTPRAPLCSRLERGGGRRKRFNFWIWWDAGQAARLSEFDVEAQLGGRRQGLELRSSAPGGELMHPKGYCIDHRLLRTGSANSAAPARRARTAISWRCQAHPSARDLSPCSTELGTS